VRLIAHRGFADEYPENTLRAVRQASSVADMIEVDVRQCGSGELVVFHDETVGRVTDGVGALSEYTLPELRALSVQESGESIPTLTAVLAALPDGVGINVELKEPVAADVLELLSTVDNEALVSSFEAEHLRAVRGIDPEVPTALIWAGGAGDPIDEALELGCRAIHPEWSLCDEAFVDRAHDAGLSINAWTVKRRSTAQDLRSLGVDGVIADSGDVVTADPPATT